MIKLLSPFLALWLFSSACTPQQELTFHIESELPALDSLHVYELITNRHLASLPLRTASFTLPVTAPTTVRYSMKGLDSEYLGIWAPGERTLRITLDSSIYTTSTADSLLNYLWASGNAMFQRHGDVLFGGDKPERVIELFDSLSQTRETQIQKKRNVLSSLEMGLLRFQNQARVQSFLLYYGRMMKGYLPHHSYFDFVPSIDKQNPWTKTLPQNTLYAFEIEYLLAHDSIANLNEFINYIEQNVISSDFQQFLKAIYLKEVIESPSYWRKHEQVFTTQFLQEALEKEKENPYSYLIHPAAKAFYATQKGEKAANFFAQTLSGDTLLLSQWQGKVVVIDVWATWCGPCLAHRPRFMELAQSYQKEPNVVFLSISIDSQPEKWKSFLKRNPNASPLTELYIGQGMDSPFADDYLIKSIPKYFIVSKQGLILESQLSEPSQAMKAGIERALEQ